MGIWSLPATLAAPKSTWNIGHGSGIGCGLQCRPVHYHSPWPVSKGSNPERRFPLNSHTHIHTHTEWQTSENIYFSLKRPADCLVPCPVDAHRPEIDGSLALRWKTCPTWQLSSAQLSGEAISRWLNRMDGSVCKWLSWREEVKKAG